MDYLHQRPNNAACSGSFVPLLTLGIPGSGTTAVMLGALLGFKNFPKPIEIFWSSDYDIFGMVILNFKPTINYS